MEEEEELSADSPLFKSIQSVCDELTQRGQEYLLVTADPASQSCMKIGSDKGREFLDVNSDVVINFFSFCFGAEIIGDPNAQLEISTEDQAQSEGHVRNTNEDLVTTSDILDPSTNTNLEDDTVSTEVNNGGIDQVNKSNIDQSDGHVRNTNEDLATTSNILDPSTNTNLEDGMVSLEVNNDSIDQVDKSNIDQVNKYDIDQSQIEKKDGNEIIDLISVEAARDTMKDISTKTIADNTNSKDVQNIENEAIGDESTVVTFREIEPEPVAISMPEMVTQDLVKIVNESYGDVKHRSEATNTELHKDEPSEEPSNLNRIKRSVSNNIDQNHLIQTVTDNSDKGKSNLLAEAKVEDPGKKTDVLTTYTNKESKKDKPSSTPKNKLTTTRSKRSPKEGKKVSNLKSSEGTPNNLALNKSRVNSSTPARQNDTNSTPCKPTCSICRATFSRIHSLKGHMLIKHQLEVSLVELETGSQSSKEKQGTSEKQPMTKSQSKKSSVKKESFLTSEVENSLNETERLKSVEVENDEIKIKKEGKRKLFTNSHNMQNKKFKADNDSNYPEIDDNSDNVAEDVEDSEILPLEKNSVVVLEENHDENVPKKIGENKKISKKDGKKYDKNIYCDLCNKYFQKEINLTIHNLRFHPSRLMMHFANNSMNLIKQEAVELEDQNDSVNASINVSFDDMSSDVKEEENWDLTQENDDVSNIDGIIDPRTRINEIKDNAKLQEFFRISEAENQKLSMNCNNCDFTCEEFHLMLVHLARDHAQLGPDIDFMMHCFYGVKIPNKKCDECSLVFKSLAALWNHIVKDHPDSTRKSTKKKRLNEIKQQYKTKKTISKCSICFETFPSIRTLDSHMSSQHPEVGKRFQCPHCSQAFSTKPNLTRHFKTIHLDEKKFICDICGKAFKQNVTLQFHRQTHEEDKPRLFECHICNKKLRKKETLQIHLRQHEGIKPYICEFCGMGFSQNGNRNKHVQQIHNDVRPVSCDKCGRSFKLTEHLKRHMKMHQIREGEAPENTYLCDIEGCGARYTSSTQLRMHTMSKHTNQRPFTCSTCDKGFITKDKLARHEQIHIEGLFECEICQKKLPNKECLAIHTKYHQIGNEGDQFADIENYDTVIIPQEHGAPIKVQLAHAEPITADALTVDLGPDDTDEQTYYIETTTGEEEDSQQGDTNTIVVDPVVIESVLGATCSDEQTVYYYVTDS